MYRKEHRDKPISKHDVQVHLVMLEYTKPSDTLSNYKLSETFETRNLPGLDIPSQLLILNA